MNHNTLEKIQAWCDVAAVVCSVVAAIESAVNRNFPEMGGWICTAILAVSAGMAHGDVRFWRKRYFEELANNVELEKMEKK